jgi:hypothetical protein
VNAANRLPNWTSVSQRLRTRSWRRRLIIVSYLTFGLLTCLIWLMGDSRGGISTTASIVLLVLVGMGWLLSLQWLKSSPVVLTSDSARGRLQRAELMRRAEEVRQPQGRAALVESLRQLDIDERLQAVRDRAYRKAYQWLTMGLSLIVFYLVASTAGLSLWVPTSLTQRLALLAIGGWIVTTLPQAIIAWTEPDEPGED